MTQIPPIEEVKEDCKAVERDISFLKCNIYDKAATPIVLCRASHPTTILPKLILFVSSRYPNVGGVAFAFEKPNAGWTGHFLEIRTAFRASAEMYSGQYGVDALLRAWASAIVKVLGKDENEESS